MVVNCMLNDTQVVTQMSFTPEHKHCWFSGRILACHAGDRGSIPRQCTVFLIIAYMKPSKQTEIQNLLFTLIKHEALMVQW